MDLAIVTGAAGRLGQTLCRKLLELGFRVYGWDHDFSKCVLQHRDFIRVACDLSSPDTIRTAWKAVEAEPGTLMALVHASGLPEAGPFESLDPAVLTHSLQTVLHAPMLLTRFALPHLIRFRGHVVTVGWNARGHPHHGALEAAIQGGLYHFGQALFDELQDTGVKVTHLYPEQTASTDPAAAKLQNPQSLVDPSLVAEALGHVLQFKEHNLIGEMVIRPRGTRENPKLAGTVVHLIHGPREVRLPSRENFPVEPEPIPTPRRARPADAPPPELCMDDEEDEDDELDRLMEQSRQFLKAQVRQSQPRQQPSPSVRQQTSEAQNGKGSEGRDEGKSSRTEPGAGEAGGSHRRRHRRRRRGGNGRQDGGQRAEGPVQSTGTQDKVSPVENKATPETVAPVPTAAPERQSGEPLKSPPPADPPPGQAKKTVRPKKAARKAVRKVAKKAAKKAARKTVKKTAEKT